MLQIIPHGNTVYAWSNIVIQEYDKNTTVELSIRKLNREGPVTIHMTYMHVENVDPGSKIGARDKASRSREHKLRVINM